MVVAAKLDHARDINRLCLKVIDPYEKEVFGCKLKSILSRIKFPIRVNRFFGA